MRLMLALLHFLFLFKKNARTDSDSFEIEQEDNS